MNVAPKKLEAETLSAEPRPKQKIISIAEKQRPEKIRVELNVEKWPALWRPAKSKGAPKVRTFEREFSTDQGIRGTSKLEVGFTQFGTITTEDQKMFYALIRQWEESGKPSDRPVFFSDRLLARLLHKKGWGTNVIEAMTSSLRRLRTTPLRWINSYHRNVGSGKSVEEETLFNFLEQLKIVTRREHGHVTNQQGYFQFGRDILQNLLNNYTKPLLDEEFFKLQTEIGQLLYTHVDLIMSDKTRYERCSKDLFTDLGLLIPENPSYRYASNRKQALEKPIAELLGKRLSTGELKLITIERTKDGKDYKVAFIKGKVTAAEKLLPPTEAVVVNDYRKKTQQGIEAEELVAYFHQRFHGVDSSEPLSKELDQASALIAKYGLEQARHIVDYTFVKAQETQFHIQHFGALLNYAVRAIADFGPSQTRKARLKAESAQREAIQKEREASLADQEAESQKFSIQLAALPPEDLHALFEAAKAAKLAEWPGMAVYFHNHSEAELIAEEGSVRSGMKKLLAEGWKPHYAINPPARQADPLQETSRVGEDAAVASVAQQPHTATANVEWQGVLNLEVILTTPQLTAAVEQTPVEPIPAQISPVTEP